MQRTLKMWTAASLMGCTVASLAFAQEGGEGGEAGAAPSQYQLLLDDAHTPHYDAQKLKQHYVASAYKQYQKAAQAAGVLRQAVAQLCQQANDKTMARARQAWISARQAYLPTEVFRYYDGPIDGPASANAPAGPEHRINAWPVNEAVLDYVQGNAKAGLVMDLSKAINEANLLAIDQVQDEADVTTGFHAIEFLLWGQDQNANGPGNRPASDYEVSKSPINQRRAQLIQLQTQLLERDLKMVAARWDARQQDSYATYFLALNDYEAVGRILRGLAMLAGEELQSERLTVALDSGTQEDETSCFSDTTHLDFAAGIQGIAEIWQSGKSASLRSLVNRKDQALATSIDQVIAWLGKHAKQMPAPFDQMLLSAPDSPQRAKAEALAKALSQFVSELKKAGLKLGVLVSAPGG